MRRLPSLAAGIILALLGACSAGSTNSANAGSTAASYARAQPVTPVPGPTTGSISGALVYPSEFAPAQAIYAVGTNGARFYLVEAITGQSHYTLVGVAPGDYSVFATLRWPPAYTAASGSRTTSQTRFRAAYTKFVQCGLAFGCGDHTLVPVHVAAGATTSSIDPTDWYAPIGYAVIPDGGPPVTVISGPQTTFDTSLAAATYLAAETTLGRFVQKANSCPVNVACVWLTGEHRGSASAYFTGSAGSNGDIQTCGFYLLK